MRLLILSLLLVGCSKQNASTIPEIDPETCDLLIKRAILYGDASILNSDTAVVNGIEYRIGAECRSKINEVY